MAATAESSGRGDATTVQESRPAAVALIDGEHYPPVVRAAMERLGSRYRFMAALFLGGAEKLRAADAVATQEILDREYGVRVYRPAEVADSGTIASTPEAVLLAALTGLLRQAGASVAVDLSDEPVVGYRERFLLASAALAAGASYVGADFELRPQERPRLGTAPTLAVIGTGKRIGKTAVSGHAARRLRSAGDEVVVLAMGRGGPPEPEVVEGRSGLTVDHLLEVSRRGRHAASDHYEDAALAAVTTIGCRRCGGGLAGAPFDSTVPEALGILRRLRATLVILEGSGSVIPPVHADATICVSAASQPVDYVTGYLGTYRLLLSDLLVLTMAEEPFATAGEVEHLTTAVARVCPGLPVLPTVFRPRPPADLTGRRVAYFTTASPSSLHILARHLSESYGADVVVASGDLADRPALAGAVRKARAEAEVFLTEIKAAAVEVVAEAAVEAGKELLFCDNEPLAIDGSDLDAAIAAAAATAKERFVPSASHPG